MNDMIEAPTTQVSEGAARQFLAFRLGTEEYGIDLLKVREIRGYETCTQIAKSADFAKGVINLRGAVVPIIDLRLLLGIGNAAYDEFTVVIILSVATKTIGVVVDGVSDVIDLAPAQIRPAPEIGTALYTKHLIGLGTISDRMVILVDIDKLVSNPEMNLIEAEVA